MSRARKVNYSELRFRYNVFFKEHSLPDGLAVSICSENSQEFAKQKTSKSWEWAPIGAPPQQEFQDASGFLQGVSLEVFPQKVETHL